MLSTRFNRWTIAAVALAVLAAPGAVWAQTPEHTADNAAQFPSKADLKSLTTSGSYLAARHASVERDAASAAAFYRSALRSGVVAGRISASSTCSSRSIWRRRIRSRCFRSATSTRR